jgi:ArsR family transcriptional regulator, arsenate/arsenite/antimonite-responsive transcriptional repressor
VSTAATVQPPGSTSTPSASLLKEPITAPQAADLAQLLKALADPTRLRLVSMVAAHEDGEACVCELTELLGLTQPTISHHLKVLIDAGILTRDKRGVWAYYALVPGALDALAAVLTGNAGRKPRRLGRVSPEVGLTGAFCCWMYCWMMLSGAPPQDAAK